MLATAAAGAGVLVLVGSGSVGTAVGSTGSVGVSSATAVAGEVAVAVGGEAVLSATTGGVTALASLARWLLWQAAKPIKITRLSRYKSFVTEVSICTGIAPRE
jgi:hypothetical protein